MKDYVVIFLFSKSKEKVLLVKRAKPPFKNCWNGVGGKIEPGETVIEASIRECKEETTIDIKNPKLLVTFKYPISSSVNSGITLNILYDFIEETQIPDNIEGHYEWKSIEFASNFNSKEIAGFANLGQIIKEIYDLEGIKKFY